MTVETLVDVIEGRAGSGRRHIFHLEDGPVRLDHADLPNRAVGRARTLAAHGVGRGDRVGILGPNRPEWMEWAHGIWRAGACVVPIAFPMRIRDREAFQEQVGGLVARLGCATVVVAPELADLVPARVALDWRSEGSDRGPLPRRPAPDDPATIQLTSGSTAEPKGALLTHRAVTTHLRLRHAVIPTRHLVSWVPFFHDWGLVNHVVASIDEERDHEVLPTERFAKDPASWFRLISESGADSTGGPPSAWATALRAAERDPSGIDLSGAAWLSMSAETIEPGVVDRAVAFGGRVGMAPEALGAGYGLAEAILGVTTTRIGSGIAFDEVDLSLLAASERAEPAGGGPSKRIACCGAPYDAFAVRIAGDGGVDRHEREVGEIWVKGPALMHAYVGQDPPNPFVDGWLRTGDLGYLVDGELYVAGRLKDMIIVGGHNYYPEDFEWAASRVEGVRPGRCVAFSRSEREIVLLVEPRDDADIGSLPEVVRHAVADAVGVRPAEVLVVPAGTVQKTTSGKLKRTAMRDAYLDGSLRSVV